MKSMFRFLIPGLIACLLVGTFLWLIREEPQPGPFPAPPELSVEDPAEPPDSAPAREAPPAAVPRGPSIAGAVTEYGTGAPIPGVSVTVHDTGFPVGCPPLVETTTDEQGRFGLPAMPVAPCRVLLDFRSPGYAPWRSSIMRLAAGERELALETIELLPATKVTGRVLLPDGSPAQEGFVVSQRLDLKLTALGDSYLRPAIHPLDEEGRFTAWVPGDLTRLLAVIHGYPEEPSAALELPVEGEVMIRLPASETVTFRVFDESGDPIAEALVAEEELGDVLGCTDRHGALVIPHPTGSFPYLHITHPEHTDVALEDARAADGVIEVRMATARWLTMRIRTPWGAAPRALVARLEGGDGSKRLLLPEGGRFRSRGLPPAAGEGLVVVPGFDPLPVRWPAGTGRHDLGTVTLTWGTGIRVAVRDPEGRPVEGAALSVRRADPDEAGWIQQHRDRRTGADGLWTIGGLAPQAAKVRAQAPGFLPTEETLRLVEGEVTDLTVTLERGGRVIGRVTGADGASLGTARVRLRIEDRPSTVSRVTLPAVVATGEDGRFSIGAIPVAGRYRLEVRAGGHAPRAVGLLPLVEGEVRDLGEIALDAGGILRGQVTDLAGAAVEGATIRMRPADDHLLDRNRSARSDGRGFFNISELEAGRYAVTALARGYLNPKRSGRNRRELRETVQLGVGSMLTLDFVLEAGLELSGTVRFSDGTPIRSAYVSIVEGAGRAELGRDSTDADGRFEIIGLLPGPAKMTVGQSWMKREFQADSVEALPREVILERGGDLEVRVSVEKGGELPSSISGWARCADGRMCGLRSAIDEGVAFFENLPPGRVTVSFTPRGFELIEAQQQVIYPGRRNRMALHLVPLEHTELLVHVVSKADGRPVRGARILAAGGEGQGETGADGVAQLKVVGAPAGLSVSAPGFASYRLQDPEMAQKNRVKITLEPAGIVTVVVKDADGTPAAGVMTVLQAIPLPGVPVRSLHSGAEITSPGGVARFGGLCSGEYELICLLDQLELARERLSLRMAEEVESAVTLPRTFTISGVVRLGGEPVTSGRLTFSRVGAPGQASTGVGAQGDYQIRLLDPGDYRIHYQGEAAWQSPAPERLASYGVLDIDIP